MDRGLRERIKEEADNHCKICGHWCGNTGSPHHVVKRSEEPLLTNCKKNVWWLCQPCHTRTETEAGCNRRLQEQLQEYYYTIFNTKKHYAVKEIVEMVKVPLKDIEKAMQKGRLKWEFVDGQPKSSGIEVIRFLQGGKLR
jgi:hypothetical protein